MNEREQALTHLEGDKLRYLNLLELLRRGSGEVLYGAEDGVLLYDRCSTAYMLTAEHQAAADTMLGLIPKTADLCVGHESWYLPALRERLGLKHGLVCHQVAWMEETPPEPYSFSGEIRPLDTGWAAKVSEHYSHDYANEAYVVEVIERGMLGAFIGGELAGFVGTHDEGTMGLLEVFPQYRRRGVAEALHRAITRQVLAKGGYALGHVEVGNEASMALQKKVGMAVSEHLVYWVF